MVLNNLCFDQTLLWSYSYQHRAFMRLKINFVRAKIIQEVELTQEQAAITLTLDNANVSFPATYLTSVSFMKMFVEPSAVFLHRSFVDFRNYAEYLIMCSSY